VCGGPSIGLLLSAAVPSFPALNKPEHSHHWSRILVSRPKLRALAVRLPAAEIASGAKMRRQPMSAARALRGRDVALPGQVVSSIRYPGDG
jgi:hypothetical protein